MNRAEGVPAAGTLFYRGPIGSLRATVTPNRTRLRVAAMILSTLKG